MTRDGPFHVLTAPSWFVDTTCIDQFCWNFPSSCVAKVSYAWERSVKLKLIPYDEIPRRAAVRISFQRFIVHSTNQLLEEVEIAMPAEMAKQAMWMIVQINLQH